jgi:flagellar FliJ protein
MSSGERLEPLYRLARSEADAAARELGQALQRQEMLSQQMAELVRYRDEYRAQLHQALSNSLRIDHAQAYRHLLERLDQAIGRQDASICHQSVLCEQARCRYLERQARLQSLDQLIQTRRKTEQSRLAVREQRRLDDLVQSRWRVVEPQS